jgi:hypothetical protein
VSTGDVCDGSILELAEVFLELFSMKMLKTRLNSSPEYITKIN